MDLSLSTEVMSDFFTKHHIHGLPFPVVLHHFSAPDRGDPHNHPFEFRTHILHGVYVEEVFSQNGTRTTIRRQPGESHEVKADCIHRIIELPVGDCYTLMLPLGPKVQEPGFFQFRDDGVYHRFWYTPEWSCLIR